MAAGPWVLPNGAAKWLLDGTINPDGDTFKLALFLSTSNLGPTSTTFAGLTNEHGTTDTGYTAGGEACPLTTTTITTNDAKVTMDGSIVWTAGSAGITAKFACLYEVGGNVLAYCLLESGGADVSATSGNTLTVAPHANGVFTVTVT
jgi:hypothetical protein